ncbi:MAG: serine/threonine protein kinase [Gemmatimonadaceae bacterium]|nr:serine/threonine protein kinase [Gemmatimonadaceae bacterium]
MSEGSGSSLAVPSSGELLRRALTPSYALERQLGRGGMGIVYLARDLTLERPVAIKVLPPEFAMRPEWRERFLYETRTAASFSHPNIVPVHAVEERGDLLCFVMGFVDGETLTERVRLGGPLGTAEAVRLIQEIAWALSYAHGRGVIHRDVKPDNILLERATGRALVTDFGIARGIAVHGADTPGEIVGTPHFMSPEQAAGDAVDGRADLYSLGIVAFYAVTARVPFDAENASAIIAQQITREAPSIAELRPDLPDGLLSTINMLLKKDPAARFQTGEAVVEALDALRAMRPDVAPSIRLFLSLAPALGIGAVALAWASPLIVRLAHYDADRALLAALVITIIVALVWRLVAGVRALAEQGFGYAAFRRAVVAANVERRAVRAQRKLAPRWRERRRRRAWGLGIGFVAAALVLAWVRVHRAYLGNGIYEVGRTGLLLAVVGAVAIMTVVLLVLSDVIGAATTTPLSHRLWTGPVGRAFYRIATIGLTESPTSTPSMSSRTR